jgi:hypothetical protein
MKKTFTLRNILTGTGILALFVVVLSSCSRRAYYGGDDIDYWMSKENGYVVYADTYCPYIVVETFNGYTIIRQTGGRVPFEGDEVFGDLSRRGYRDFYNYMDNSIFRGEVTDYWLSYSEAQYVIDNLCYTYGRGGEKKQIKQGLYKKR